MAYIAMGHQQIPPPPSASTPLFFTLDMHLDIHPAPQIIERSSGGLLSESLSAAFGTAVGIIDSLSQTIFYPALRCLINPVLKSMGFTRGGPRGGSLAAALQARPATQRLFGILQSAAMRSRRGEDIVIDVVGRLLTGGAAVAAIMLLSRRKHTVVCMACGLKWKR